MKRLTTICIISLALIINIISQWISASTIISPDRIWEYVEEDIHSYKLEITKYRFGDTVERHGKIYTPWILIEKETRIGEDVFYGDEEDEDYIYNPNDFGEEWACEITTPNEVVALLREEDDKVYMLLEDDGEEYYFCTMNPVDYTKRRIKDGEEVVLYDLSAQVGDYHFTSERAYLTPDYSEAIVVDRFELYNMGRRYKVSRILTSFDWILFCINNGLESPYPPYQVGSVLNLEKGSGIEYADELGVISRGTLIWPNRYYVGCGCQHHYLFRVYESEELIYEQPRDWWYFSSSSVKESKLNGKNSSSATYDLMGREVKNPVSGTLYVKGGKKFIAR